MGWVVKWLLGSVGVDGGSNCLMIVVDILSSRSDHPLQC